MGGRATRRGGSWGGDTTSGGNAPANAPYVTTAADGSLSGETLIGAIILPPDIFANRPAAAGLVAGTLFTATDTDETYRADGAGNWVSWGRVPTIPKLIAYSPTLVYKAPNSTPTTLAANTAYYIPFVLWIPTAINAVVFEVGTSSGNVCGGIYDDDGTAGVPGTRLATSGSTACPVSGGASVATAAGTLPPGNYYAALSADNATATFRFSGQSSVVNGMGQQAYTQATAFPLPTTATPVISTQANQFQFLAANI